MSNVATTPFSQFDISTYTNAPLRMQADIEFERKTCEQVWRLTAGPKMETSV